MTGRDTRPVDTAPAQGAASDSGVANFRDLGGMPLSQGGTTRYGQIYRSDALFHRDNLPAEVRHFTWATVIDLRSPREFGAGVAWAHGGRHERVPLLESAAPAALDGDLPGLYAHLARNGGHGLAQVVDLVGSCRGPTLVHCSFGKDRTGMVAAVLQILAGVRRSAVLADYMLSRRRSHAVMARLAAHGFTSRRPLRDEHFDAPADAISAALGVLDSWPGGVRGYLIDHGASPVSIESAAGRLAADRSSSDAPRGPFRTS